MSGGGPKRGMTTQKQQGSKLVLRVRPTLANLDELPIDVDQTTKD
jgi:hypothetical protein